MVEQETLEERVAAAIMDDDDGYWRALEEALAPKEELAARSSEMSGGHGITREVRCQPEWRTSLLFTLPPSLFLCLLSPRRSLPDQSRVVSTHPRPRRGSWSWCGCPLIGD